MRKLLSILGIIFISYSLAAPVHKIPSGESSIVTNPSLPSIDQTSLQNLLIKIQEWGIISPNDLGIIIENTVLPTMKAIEQMFNQHDTLSDEKSYPLLRDAIDVLHRFKETVGSTDVFSIVQIHNRFNNPPYIDERMTILRLQHRIQEKLLDVKELHLELRRNPAVSSAKSLNSIEYILRCVMDIKEAQRVLTLFSEKVSAEQMIYSEFQTLQKNVFASIDMIDQFMQNHELFMRYKYIKTSQNQPTTQQNFISTAYPFIDPTNIDPGPSENFPSPSMVFEKTKAIKHKLADFLNSIQNGQPMDSDRLESWLQIEVIPYMKDIEKIMFSIGDDKNYIQDYNYALLALDDVHFLLKDAAFSLLPKGFFPAVYSQPPNEFFEAAAILPKTFFTRSVFFEHSIMHHLLLVKQKLLEMNRKPSIEMKEMIVFAGSKKGNVLLINRYEAILKLQSLKKTVNEMMMENLEKFCQKPSVSMQDIEGFFMDNKGYWELHQDKDFETPNHSVLLLDLQPSDIFHTALPSLSELRMTHPGSRIDRYSLVQSPTVGSSVSAASID